MTDKITLVAVDGGSGNIAIRFKNGAGEEQESITPARIRRGVTKKNNRDSVTAWETVNGETYSTEGAVNNQDVIDTCDPNYQTSDANRVLVINALAQSGLAGKDIVIGDTLPAAQFYSDTDAINRPLIAAKKESLRQQLKNVSGDIKAPVIRDVIIFPEAVAAYAACTTDERGKTRPEFVGVEKTLVVDLGRFTCDIAVVTPDKTIISRRTSENGVQKMIQRLHMLLQKNEAALGLTEAKEINLTALDDYINLGYIGSKAAAREKDRIDIKPLVHQAAESLALDVFNDIRSTHRNLIDIDVVLFVGGGANWLGGKLSYLPNFAENWHSYVYIPDEPQMANVRGVYRELIAYEDEIIASVLEKSEGIATS
ncbi:MAG TPA: ParM/StbA family protein [Buttiauxella sp.]|jgi:plasmid segregation protein ParM